MIRIVYYFKNIMKITILIILVYSFFIKSFAFAESEDVHKSDLNYLLASYLILEFDDFENSGDSLVSRQEYEGCLVVSKIYLESGDIPDRGKDNACAAVIVWGLFYPSEIYADWNNIEKEEIIENLDLFWDFDTIDTNVDDYIEINEFYDHLMNDTPHTFFDILQGGVSYETLAHSINLPNIEKTIEYQWREMILLFNESDDFMNETIDNPFYLNEYDLNFNGSIDFSEFRIVKYLDTYLGMVGKEAQNEHFESDLEIYKNSYFELLSQTELKPKKNKRSVSNCLSNDVLDYSDFLCSEKKEKWYSCGSSGSYVISGTSKICLASCYYYDEDLGKYGKGADYFLTGVLGYLNEFQNCSSISYDHPLSEDNVDELGLW